MKGSSLLHDKFFLVCVLAKYIGPDSMWPPTQVKHELVDEELVPKNKETLKLFVLMAKMWKWPFQVRLVSKAFQHC